MENLSPIESHEILIIDKNQVIEALRANPEDFSLLGNFLDQEQKKIVDSRGTLDLNITLAEIYRDAELTELAIEAYTDAADQAWQEREDELCKQLQNELDQLTGD